MTRILRLFLAFLFLAAPAALACNITAYRFEPAQPREGQIINLHIQGVCPSSCKPTQANVNINGNVITMDFPGPGPNIGCLTVITPYEIVVTLGTLPAGSYEIRLTGMIQNTIPLVIPRNDATLKVSPRSGPGGTQVMLEYPGLLNCSGVDCHAPVVTFGGVPATRVAFSGRDRILVTVPDHAPGLVDITITPQGGPTLTFDDAFRYFNAGTPDADLARVLFPLVLHGPGAHGSEWQTFSTIRNDLPIDVRAEGVGTIPGFGGRVNVPMAAREGGLVLRVHRDVVSELAYGSHIRDISRSATNNGTEIPVVHEDDTDDVVRILDVPVDTRFRATLRIFDIDSVDGRIVRVRIKPSVGVLQASETAVTLRTVTRCAIGPCLTPEAAHAVLDLRTLFPNMMNVPYDVDVIAEDAGARLWAFVSVTNNDTQHVTTYSPQQ